MSLYLIEMRQSAHKIYSSNKQFIYKYSWIIASQIQRCEECYHNLYQRKFAVCASEHLSALNWIVLLMNSASHLKDEDCDICVSLKSYRPTLVVFCSRYSRLFLASMRLIENQVRASTHSHFWLS